MRVGPKKKPTKTKILQGTLNVSRINPNEPEPDCKIPDPPDHLSKEALAEWNRIAPELDKMGLISEVDMASFAAYCQAYGRWAVAETLLNESEGLTIETMQGNIIQNPLVGIANVAMEMMRKHLANFGMSPADRAKVSSNKPTDKTTDNGFSTYGAKAK